MGLSRRSFIAGVVAVPVAASIVSPAVADPADMKASFEGAFNRVFRVADHGCAYFDGPTDEPWVRIDVVGASEQEALSKWYAEAASYADGRGADLYWNVEPTTFETMHFDLAGVSEEYKHYYHDETIVIKDGTWTATGRLLVSDEPWKNARETIQSAGKHYNDDETYRMVVSERYDGRDAAPILDVSELGVSPPSRENPMCRLQIATQNQ